MSGQVSVLEQLPAMIADIIGGHQQGYSRNFSTNLSILMNIFARFFPYAIFCCTFVLENQDILASVQFSPL